MLPGAVSGKMKAEKQSAPAGGEGFFGVPGVTM